MTIPILLLAAVLLTLIASYFTFRYTFYADRRKMDDPYVMLNTSPSVKIDAERVRSLVREIMTTPHEDVEIRSFDGLTLRGRYYPGKKGAPLAILMHGYRSLGARDFCGTFRIFPEMGYSILMPDERAHGASEGHVISFGILERHDCLSWANYAHERFGDDTDIVLMGLSMGAATVLMASSLPLPENVRCIIADSAYTSPRDIIAKVARDKSLPARLLMPFVRIGAYMFGHFSLDDAAAEREIEKNNRPVFLLHGEGDFFVPSFMSRRLFRAAKSEKQLLILPNNGHCASYIFNTERYINAIEAFCRRFAEGKKYEN